MSSPTGRYQKLTQAQTGRVLAVDISHLPFGAVADEVMNRAQQRQGGYYCFTNVHMAMEAWWHPAFAAVVNGAVRALPDGVPIRWALRLLYGIRAERVAGMDFMPVILARCAESAVPVYFYGGAQSVLDAAVVRATALLPSLTIAGAFSPPFRALTPEEEAQYVAAIRASGAGLVCVALGCPKQENWMARHAADLDAVLLGIGGALPAYAGMQRRAPRWMQRAGLEWFFRWLQEPQRLFRRYAVTNTAFVWHLGLQWLLGRSAADAKSTEHNPLN
jgi:N-acetylglucosaminyldiphosphoundecaprenol N-acetyl-beta-D-mannosaminyltransferase